MPRPKSRAKLFTFLTKLCANVNRYPQYLSDWKYGFNNQKQATNNKKTLNR